MAAGGLDPRIAGRTGALADVMMQQGDWQVPERGKRALQIIVGTVIDDDDLKVGIGLGAHALQRPANFMGPVMDRDNDTDQGILLDFRHVCFALWEKGLRREGGDEETEQGKVEKAHVSCEVIAREPVETSDDEEGEEMFDQHELGAEEGRGGEDECN